MLRIVIIEDETATMEMLTKMIQQTFSDVEIIGSSDSVANGVNTILSTRPDVVLLDINLKDGDGFEILEKTSSLNYMVVFITAHSDYAVKAFKISAVDYILKPVDISELVNAIEKCKKQNEIEQISTKLNTLFSNIRTESNQEKKVVLKSAESIHVVLVSDIVRCEADKSYTTFFLKDGRKLIVSRTLKEFDELLTEYGFFRSHQSHLVNTKFIDSYEKPQGGLLVMHDKSRVPVATRKREALFDLFNNL